MNHNYLKLVLSTLGAFVSVINLGNAAVKDSIVRIVSDSKATSDSSHVASGFVYSNRKYVVTAYHAIAAATKIRVTYGDEPDRYIAKPIKSLPSQDLALLEVEAPPEAKPLKAGKVGSDLRSMDLWTIGFPYGFRTPRSTEQISARKHGGSNLRDVIRSIKDEDSLQKITEQGWPDLSAPILDIEGVLVPGMSGAPILNEDNELIAIVNGGLEKGSTNYCWAIPSEAIIELFKAKSFTKIKSIPDKKRLEIVFSAELKSEIGKPVHIGGKSDSSLVKMRTRTFAELTSQADEPLGLQQLIQMMHMIGVTDKAMSEFKFDIYQDVSTGATVVLPEGSKLRIEAGMFVTSFVDGVFDVHIDLQQASTAGAAQMQSVQFENKLMQLTKIYNWQLDQSMSYGQPLILPNGVTVMRKGALGLKRRDPYPPIPDDYLFEVVAYHKAQFLGVAVINRKFGEYNEVGRVFNKKEAKMWSQLILGVQFSSFGNSHGS